MHFTTRVADVSIYLLFLAFAVSRSAGDPDELYGNGPASAQAEQQTTREFSELIPPDRVDDTTSAAPRRCWPGNFMHGEEM